MSRISIHFLFILFFSAIPYANANANAFANQSRPLTQVFSHLGVSTPAIAIDASKIYASVSLVPAENDAYRNFHGCISAPSVASCGGSVLVARFYDIARDPTHSTESRDTFDNLNRCTTIRQDKKIDAGPVQLVLGGAAISCNPPGNSIQVVHAILCYGKASAADFGAYCSLATACFEGPKAQGQCTRDYQGEEIKIKY